MNAYSVEVWQVGDLTDTGTPDGRPSYDTALPLSFYGPVFKLAGRNLSGEIVWYYPPTGQPFHLMGEPRALTEAAARILALVNSAGNSLWKR